LHCRQNCERNQGFLLESGHWIHCDHVTFSDSQNSSFKMAKVLSAHGLQDDNFVILSSIYSLILSPHSFHFIAQDIKPKIKRSIPLSSDWKYIPDHCTQEASRTSELPLPPHSSFGEHPRSSPHPHTPHPASLGRLPPNLP